MTARPRFDKDYYAILALHPEAMEGEIRRAYRRLALQWHPDRNPDKPEAEERFKAISEAYAVLIDPAKRKAYDRARRTGMPGDFHVNREDLFRDLFADPRASAIFEELARELERIGMRVNRHDFHRTLFGGRAVITGGVFIVTPLTPVLTLFRLVRAALRGAQAAAVKAEARPLPPPAGILDRIVRGARWLWGLPPARALADGDVTVRLRLTRAEAERGGRKQVQLSAGQEVMVTIPPGIRDGTRLRLRGKGQARAGGAPGDAYLAIEIAD